MKLEDQVCSLELAKKLKELGVKQESHFFWTEEYYDHFIPEKIGRVELLDRKIRFNPGGKTRFYSAYTVSELGEMMPRSYSYKNNGKWRCLDEGDKSICRTFFDADTEADARTKMLIHLIETGIVKL